MLEEIMVPEIKATHIHTRPFTAELPPEMAASGPVNTPGSTNNNTAQTKDHSVVFTKLKKGGDSVQSNSIMPSSNGALSSNMRRA